MDARRAMTLLAALALPFTVQAAQYGTRSTRPASEHGELSYTLGEARVLAADPDAGDDADGIRLAGSVLLQENFFVRGAAMSARSGGRSGNDIDSLEIGAGMRHPASTSMDLVGTASLVRIERELGRSGDAEGWGPALTGGIRALLAPRVEVGGFLGFARVLGDNEISLLGEGLYHFTPNLSAVAGLALSDDTREANLGARWNFR